MKNYEIYFEIYGKKLKTTILAESEEKAKEMIRGKIIFHKINAKKQDVFNQITDTFDNFQDFLNGFKKR